MVQAQAKGCLGSRQTTEAEAGLELWREQPPTLVSDSFVLSHPACDVTQETVSGTGSQAHGPGLSLGGCPAISVWGVCYAAVSWPLVTIHMPPGEVTVDAATRAPSGSGGCSGKGRSRWAAAPCRGLREVWWGRGSVGEVTVPWPPHQETFGGEPEGRAVRPVLLRDKDQCAERGASDQAREAFLCCAPVVNPLRAPRLEHNFRSRPELRSEVRQHTRQGGGTRRFPPTHMASPTGLWAVASPEDIL